MGQGYAHPDGLNIYLYPDPTTYTTFYGMALQVMSNELYLWGNYCDTTHTPLLKTHIFAHEVGHCLGLLHTFESSGDLVDDTPIDTHGPFPLLGNPIGCTSQNIIDCSLAGDTIVDTRNIMSYFNHKYCADHLTVGQIDRIKYVVGKETLLQACLVQPKVITSDTVWNTDQAIDNVIITNGATLEIVSSTIKVVPNRTITIKKGAKLILDGTTLTTDACMWGGIIIEGDSSVTQIPSNQGYLVLKNNSTIEYAWNAIRAWDGEDLATSGGMINAKDTRFHNNWRDVELMQYTRESSVGYIAQFKNCLFDLDDDYRAAGLVTPPALILSARISNWACKGVSVVGCSFENNVSSSAPFDVPSFASSSALFSYDGTFNVHRDTSASIFRNFNYGIWASGPYTIKQGNLPFDVHDSEFYDCHRGIFFSEYNFPIVRNNAFQVPQSSITWEPDEPETYGTYFEQCLTYTLSDNDYKGQGYPDEYYTYGAVLHNRHGANEVVARNLFDNLTIGSQAIGQNKSANPSRPEPGLQYTCNDFSNGRVDIHAVANSSGTDSLTGIAILQGSMTEPAGNLFGNSSPILEENLLNTGSLTGGYRYLHHDPTANSRVRPDTISTNVFRVNTSKPSQADDCKIKGDTIGNPWESVQAQRAMINIYRLTLESMKDGGNTDVLKQAVITATNTDAWQKYMQLMNEAGYLSDEVLAKVAAKEYAFTDAMIRDILVANPQAAKSWAVQEKLDERFNPLPLFMRNQIDQGLQSISPLEYIELNLTDAQREHDATLNYYIKSWLNDANTDRSADVLNLITPNYSPEYDYLRARLHDDRGEYTQAAAILANIPNLYNYGAVATEEHERYSAYRGLMHSWKQGHKDLAHLNPEAIEQLQGYADKDDAAGRAAYNLLVFNGVKSSNEPLYTTNGAPKKARRYGQTALADENKLNLYPNPSSDYFTVDYDFNLGNNMMIVITDFSGRVIKRQRISTNKGQLTISTEDLNNGQYYCTFMSNGKAISNIMLSVLH